ncbi:CPX chromosomal region candidate gene 1 protein [Molossus nigricans]
MSSPTKEESDPADNALKNSKNEAPNDSSTATEPSFAESSMISEVESNPMNRELDMPTSQEHAILQPAEEQELEVEKKPRNPQEDIKEEESLLHQVPIPEKLTSHMSGLRRPTHPNAPPANTNRTHPLPNRARFHTEKNQRKTSDICYINVNYKIPFQFSISWRIPFINRYERRRMILQQLCERHLPQNTTCVKQKYVAHVIRPNVLNQRVRRIIFGRHSRAHHYYPPSKRMALKMMSKSNDTKKNEELQIFVRPALDAPRTQSEDKLTRRALDDPLRSHHYMRAVIITTDDGWKYLCPICGSIFNTLLEFRQHSCNFSKN